MEIVAKAKEEVHTGIENLRYKKGEINSLPNGRLKECAAWTASDDTALRVTMENPDSLYLRGFVGSTYNGSEWKSISTGDAYKQKNLFTGCIRVDFMQKHSWRRAEIWSEMIRFQGRYLH